MDYGRKKHPYWNDSKRGRLRGNRSEEDEELLCFGYSCKLFRDDEKALYIDREEHLIPWMGDTNLMIDRFDVRGALYSLNEAEFKGQPFEEVASEVELKEEELCDQERYMALYHDETELQMQQEEEAKRLQYELYADGTQYGQVGFDYSTYIAEQAAYQEQQSEAPAAPQPVTYNPTTDDDMFIPPPELTIPVGMEVPQTNKQNKVIMKTAKFIVQQGAQMEIVIKTKQAGNAMFNFLAFDNILNPYYKHAVHMIRNGRYRWEDEPESKSDSNDSYLHQNLPQSLRPDLTPGVVASPRPSPHCAYSKLITKIKEKQKGFDEFEISSPIAPSSPVTNEASQSVSESCHSIDKTNSTPRPIGVSQQNQSTPQLPIVGLVDYPSFNQTADGSSDMEDSEPFYTKSCLRNLSHDYTNIKWPPPEIQMVIDKMASYIIKNGSAFEEIVKSRRDSRFDFLKKTHIYYAYYQCKLQLYKEVYGDTSFKNKSNKDQDSGKKKEASKATNRAISFSIRSRDHDGSITSHSSFPVESSTSEENDDIDEQEKEKRRQEREKRRVSRREKEKREREEFIRKERLRREKEEEEQMKQRLEGESSGNEDLYDIFKYAQEMAKDKSSGSESPEMFHVKQEVRKKKAAAFLSKLKDDKKSNLKPIYGPELPNDFVHQGSRSLTQSPTSSSADGDKPPPLPPPSMQQPPPPLPKSPSPQDDLRTDSSNIMIIPPKSSQTSTSPLRKSNSLVDSTMSELLIGAHDGSKTKRSRTSDSEERSRRKNRKKHSRLRSKSRSRSSSSRRSHKKRKRRKKRRSRSRSREHQRSHGHSHSRSTHKKKQSRHKDKSRKKKQRRQRSPSSTSSLPSSESSSPSTPSTLPSESDSDMDVQVIESGDDMKKISRSSSVVSVVSEVPKSGRLLVNKSNGVKALASKMENPGSGEDETSSGSSLLLKHHSLLKNEDKSGSSSEVNGDRKPLFNPSTSKAMANIAQGLRAKLNAMLEKENSMN